MKHLLIALLVSLSPFVLNAQEMKIDSFMQNPFPVEQPSPEYFQDAHWWRVNTEKQPVKNKHNKKLTDTIVRVNIGGSHVRFYKARHKTLLLSGYIKNKRIKLKNGISVWMKREEFFERFSDLQYSEEDMISVGGDQGFKDYTFVFQWNRLRSIEFKFYAD